MKLIEDGETIDSSNISVIIQGLTHYVEGDENCLFYRCVNSIKKYLPNAEIVVSTWVGQKCDESIVNHVLYNKEPPSFLTLHDKTWNYNKMVVSTFQGICSCTKKYVLKFRADLFLKGVNFFKIYKNQNNDNELEKYILNERSINVTNLYMRKPTSYACLLFHISDVVQFGSKEDMTRLWDRKILKYEDAMFSKKKIWMCFFYPYMSNEKLVPEQTLMVGWLNRNNFSIKMKFPGFVNFYYFKISELLISLNFHTYDWQDSDIVFPNRFIDNIKDLKSTLYTSHYINEVFNRSKEDKFFEKKYISVLWVRYFSRFFSISIWISFLASLLLCISPRLFFKLKENLKN